MSVDAEPYLRIQGQRPLHGEVRVNGSKNAALPCLAATLLTDESCQVRGAPEIEDVRRFRAILAALGMQTTVDDEAIATDPRPRQRCPSGTPPDQLVSALRASFLVVGPLLARTGEAICGAPGGDVIGARPLDVHLAGFRALGAEVETVGARTISRAPNGLHGATIVLDYPSVLGTENLLLAAVLAAGRTRLINAAMEPEIVCLSEMLNAMGAQISGAGQHTITIDGVAKLAGVTHSVIPDRIEAGTLLIAAAASRGEICLQGVEPTHLEALTSKLQTIGVCLRVQADTITLSTTDTRLTATNVQALPYPGFATDLQAPITALLTQAEGASIVHERVFENRMQHLDELRKFGASIIAGGAVSAINGPSRCSGAVVRGGDIRATAALVVAALAAEGESRVYGVHHLNRGYANLADQLTTLGADVELISPTSPVTSTASEPHHVLHQTTRH